jgi:rhodanese-related sulfurtransferase
MEQKSPAQRIAAARARIRNIDVETAAAERDAGAVVVDVREADERREHGVIPGAIHIPLSDVEQSLDRLDRDGHIIFHCAGGGRSALAADLVQEQGFRNVANLEGGFAAWNAAGKPVAAEGGTG